jgi:TIR domain-containing protein
LVRQNLMAPNAARQRLRRMSDGPCVFISHADGDSDVANALEQFLREAFASTVRTFNVSNDRSLLPGDDWWRTIERNLRGLKVMLVVVTPQNSDRPWIHFEAGAAWLLDKRVVPCLARGMSKSSLPTTLAHFQAVSLGVERDVHRLLRTIAKECNAVTTPKLMKRTVPRRFDAIWSNKGANRGPRRRL